jgi:maleate isomerase
MTRIGVILTYDNAIDPELWRWSPPGVSLHITRTGFVDWKDEVLDNERLADPKVVSYAVKSLTYIEPTVTAFACTSGSFARGLAGERAIRRTMMEAGAKKAITTSGAMLEAFAALGVKRLAVAHPYSEVLGAILGRTIKEAGFDVCSLVGEMPQGDETLNDISSDDVIQMAERAFRPEADAIFLSCTALDTLDAITVLEERYQRPVISAAQATMWSALAAAGVECPPLVAGQRLYTETRDWAHSEVSS